MTYSKRLILLCACIVYMIAGYAQSKNTSIIGQVYDNTFQEGVAQATIQLLSLPDSAMVKGTTSDLDGNFTLKGIIPNKYVLKISFIGYKPILKVIEAKSLSKGLLDLGRIDLETDAILLKEAVVTAEAPTVTLSADTVMFNASAYRVTQNAMLEELVKKLPGAQVDDDGKITINGKEISKIMIDGKEFFAKDPNIAMKNLPVDMIEKIKTYDKKSDQARITGIDDGEEETVLDLSVKKDMNRGWFGNVDLGYGNHDRYTAKGMINRFSDGDQVTGVFNFNNVRDATIGSGRGRRGGRQRGVEDNKSGGMNFGIERKKFTLGGNANYSDREVDLQTKTSSETFLKDGSSYSNGFSNSLNNNKSFSSDFRMEWRPDSLTTLLFLPSLNFGKGNNGSIGESKTGDVDDFTNWEGMLTNNTAINSTVSNSQSKSDNISTSGFFMFNRKLGKLGRNVGFNVNYNVGSSDSKSTSYTKTEYYKTAKTDERNLLTDNDNNNSSIRFRLNYSEPIAKNRFLQMSYSYQRSYNKTDRKTYNLFDWETGGGGDLDDYLDASLSKMAKSYYDNHEMSVKLNTVKEKYTYNIGFSVQPQRNRMKYQQNLFDIDTVRTVINFTPVFDYRYKFTKQSQLRIIYRGRPGQPNMTDLLPIRDETNPLNIREGNPGLKPSYTNMFMLFYNGYFSKTQRSVVANIFFQNTINSVSSKVTYDPTTGGRVTRPENINGNWNLSIYSGFNTPLKNKKFTISDYASFRYNNIMGYLSQGANEEVDKNKTKNLTARNDLSFNYRNDWFESGLNTGFEYGKVANTLQPQSNRETYDYSVGLNTNVKIPWDVNLSSDISYIIRNGYSLGDDKTQLIWNAQVSKSFLKKRQATISFQIFDILRQRSNLSRSISASMRNDTEYNEISNYFMVHFVYNLNTFGGKGKGGTQMNKGRSGGQYRRIHY